MFDSQEEGGEAGGRGAGVGPTPVIPPAALPHGNPASIMLARRIARWMRRRGPRVFGGLDFEMAESLLVNEFCKRWGRVATTPELRAAVQVLTELGGFIPRDRPQVPPSKRPVLMLRVSEAGLRYAEDEIDRMRNQLPAAVAGRRTGPWLPNLLYYALRDHGVPPDQRQAAARYIDQHVVRPYLTSLGYTGPNPEGELLYTNAQPRPAAKLPPSIVAQKALAALVAPAAPPVTPEPSPEPAPERVAECWVDAAGRKRQRRPAAAPAPQPAPSAPPSAAPAPAGYLPSPAPATAPSGPPSAPTAAPLAGTGNGLVGLSPEARARHLAKAQAILARIGITAANEAPVGEG